MNLFKPILVMVNNGIVIINRFAKAIGDSLGKILGWKYEVGSGGTVLDDYADSAEDAAGGMGSAGKAAEKLKRQLQGFDELNNLTSPDDGGSGGGGGGGASGISAGGASDMAGRWVETEKLYESDWDTWFKLGRGISEAWTEGLNSIDWDKVYNTARNWGRGLANFLNGLVTPDLFYAVGKTLSNSLNTVVYGAMEFADTLNWTQVGNSISSGLNGFLENFDFIATAQTVHKISTGILTTLITALDGVNWYKFGNGLSDAIGALNIGDITSKLSDLAISIVQSLSLAISGVDWGIVGREIGKALNGAKFTQLIGSLAELALNIVKALGQAMLALAKENPFGAALAGLLMATKISGVANILGGVISSSIGKSAIKIPIKAILGISLLVSAFEFYKDGGGKFGSREQFLNYLGKAAFAGLETFLGLKALGVPTITAGAIATLGIIFKVSWDFGEEKDNPVAEGAAVVAGGAAGGILTHGIASKLGLTALAGGLGGPAAAGIGFGLGGSLVLGMLWGKKDYEKELEEEEKQREAFAKARQENWDAYVAVENRFNYTSQKLPTEAEIDAKLKEYESTHGSPQYPNIQGLNDYQKSIEKANKQLEKNIEYNNDINKQTIKLDKNLGQVSVTMDGYSNALEDVNYDLGINTEENDKVKDSFVNLASNGLTTAIDGLLNFSSKMQETGRQSTSTTTGISGQFSGMSNNVLGSTNLMGAGVSLKFSEMLSSIMNNTGQAKTNAEQNAEGMRSAWTSKLSKMYEETSRQTTNMKDSVSKWSTTVKDIVSKTTATAKFNVSTPAVNTITSAINNLKSKWTGKDVNFTINPNATSDSAIQQAYNGKQSLWHWHNADFTINPDATSQDHIKSTWDRLSAAWQNKTVTYDVVFNAAGAGALGAGLGADAIAKEAMNVWIGKLQSKLRQLPFFGNLSLSRFATGGVVDKTTIAMIGEAGTEAVVPLERNTQWLGKMSDMLVSEMERTQSPRYSAPAYTGSTSYSASTRGTTNSDLAIQEQNALLREEIDLLRQIASKDLSISSRDVFNATRSESENYYNKTGNAPFIF